jgi:hypothetical protein
MQIVVVLRILMLATVGGFIALAFVHLVRMFK